jgi:uncharacterized protein YaiI (UPF0178 family)
MPPKKTDRPRNRPLPRLEVEEVVEEVLREAATADDVSISAYMLEAILQRLEREGRITRDSVIESRLDMRTGKRTKKIRISQADTEQDGCSV